MGGLSQKVDIGVRRDQKTRGMRRFFSAKTQIASRMHTFISHCFFCKTDLWMLPTTAYTGPLEGVFIGLHGVLSRNRTTGCFSLSSEFMSWNINVIVTG
ncbi:hypothetical protein Zmor_026006 [Zophobas morio]|uniref:Uncharacterized protein n=1 Tax=Zophobas morio TaxID=2755281 RepID=A0AA38M525_9CUCU|nr:hypothetical protein Zmor_026006 [Zophobas morio]